jgi:hypothetical protein
LAEREAYSAQFVGQPEADLVRQLGVPTRTIESGDARFLAYVETRRDYIRPIPGFALRHYLEGADYLPTQVIERTCETTYEIAAGKVAVVRIRGNGCA